MKKTSQLKQLVQDRDLSFLLEAHNGLSAKLVQEAGFPGIWASGLAISASLGVRDNNEASWTQVLEVLEFMSDATTIPILHDGDTGYGNFNSMRRLVRKLEQRGIAGVCIEDKIFPKTNSFIRGAAQPLADIDEFAGKIKAGKDAQQDDDFVIVARVEAFIAGWGLEEALRRAEAYRQAGADAILIHSARRDPNEILAFKREWGDRLPVVIVPTKYHSTPTSVFREHGFSLAIWANHLMRSAVTAMRATAQQIFRDQSLAAVEPKVVSVDEVFRLQGEEELAQAERKYLPDARRQVRGVLLAASAGHELGALTRERPKCMLPVAGRPLLAHVTDAYRSAGIKALTVVRGFNKETVSLSGLNYVDNDDYASSGEVYSLYRAREALAGAAIIAYGDVLLQPSVPRELASIDADFAIAVDASWRPSKRSRQADLVCCSEPCTRQSFLSKVTLAHAKANEQNAHGEWMGILFVSDNGALALKLMLDTMAREAPDTLRHMSVPHLLDLLIANGHQIRVIYTAGRWVDVDGVADVAAAGGFVSVTQTEDSLGQQQLPCPVSPALPA